MAEALQIEGLVEMQRRLAGLPQHVHAAVARALYEEALRIMAASQSLVPIDTGLLRSTGKVETENEPSAAAVVKLSYGGGGIAPYALVVHERLDVHHPVGRAKYLQEPFFEALHGMEERLAASIRQQLGGT